jgi:hypothetical protein
VTPEQEIANNLPPAAMAFFILFSRFECALKRAKYIQADASAAWDRFGKELGKGFFDQVKATGKAKTLLENPPKKQVVANGGLGWKPMKPPSTSVELLVAIRRARNNLFHGGKYSTGFEADISRDQTLLEESRWVLHRALEASAQVQVYFNV